MLVWLLLGGWVLVALACSLVLGGAVRRADVQECAEVSSLPRPAEAEQRDARQYQQASLFDAITERGGVPAEPTGAAVR